jgi:hypothetical protein
MSDETDEAGNLAPTMTQAELTEIGKAESWEDAPRPGVRRRRLSQERV